MKTKDFVINSLLVITSITLPLIIINIIIIYAQRNIKKDFNLSHQVIKEKIVALKDGYLPIINPNYILHNSSNIDIYPIGSIPNTKLFLCNEGYGLIKYKSDRFGLRNNDKKWNYMLQKSNVFVIGDSFVHGACVQNELTIPYQVQKITGINSINIGNGGSTPYEYTNALKSLVDPIISQHNGSNWIVLTFYDNDDIYSNFGKTRFKNKLKETSSILSISQDGEIIPKDAYKESIIQSTKKLYNYSIIEAISILEKSKNKTIIQAIKSNNIRYFKDSIKFIFPPSKYNSPSIKAIEQLLITCTKDCTPLIVYIPNSNYWDPRPNRLVNLYKDLLIEKSKETGVRFIDGELVINRDNINDYAPNGGHLSKHGYKKLSQLISTYIK